MNTVEPQKSLRRSRDDALFAGVCGGLGAHYGLDPVKIRIVYALLTLFSGFFPGIVIYLVLWFIIPLEDN